MNPTFKNKVVAISGAGKGLGRAYALHFAKLGAHLVVNNRRHEGEAHSSADILVSEIEDAGGSAVAQYSDVEDSDAGEKLLETALNTFGRIDAVVANAGIAENTTFQKLDLAQIRRVIDINLTGTINFIHAAYNHMCAKDGGSIVVSASSAGLYGQYGLPAYSASKAAVIGLMRALSLEGASYNVSVNAIAPYATTNMTSAHMPEEIQRKMDPAAVAPVVARLAVGDITGQTWVAGGGYVAKAEMRNSELIDVPDADSSVWNDLATADVSAAYDDATKNFERFLK